jgi:serine phosphatase RsbU (regulator of sigma subunit)
LFSDGYADQFGGPNGKKFKHSQLKEIVFSIHQKSLKEQKKILNEIFEKWKGSLDQVDDVLVMGIRV